MTGLGARFTPATLEERAGAAFRVAPLTVTDRDRCDSDGLETRIKVGAASPPWTRCFKLCRASTGTSAPMGQ